MEFDGYAISSIILLLSESGSCGSIDRLGKRRDPQHAEGRRYPRNRNFRPVDLAGLDLLSKLERLGPQEREMCSRISKQVLKKPEAGEFVAVMLLQYMQIRYMYEQGQFWESHLN